jgi:diguanylate cyclase (GGDEF)-like protein
MSASELPPALVEGLLRLCQGDFSYRVPRSLNRNSQDTAAFFVNAIAEELERIISRSREQEQHLTRMVEQLSAALTRVATGDFSVQVARDFSGDAPDVLAFLVNNTILELGEFVSASHRRAEEDRRRLERLVEERTAELKVLATTDELTGTLNRRRFFEVAEQEQARSERYRRPLAVAMLDLDHFKAVNDRHGHAVGDEALKLAAQVMQRVVRRQDHVGRYGGEEFGVVLPETRLEEAAHVLERVRREIARIELCADGVSVPLRVSAGVAAWQAGEVIDTTFKRADGALYEAKQAGRDRVHVACSALV